MNKNCSHLSKDFNNEFWNYISEFKNNSGNVYQGYDVFYPSFGTKDYAGCDFLIYGQSIKGWQPSLKELDKLNKDEFIKSCISYSNDYAEGHNPIDWVNVLWSNETYNKNVLSQADREFYGETDYRTSRSFFWNVVYKLVNRYKNISDDNSFEWSNYIVWSNLYKIAPSAKTNPDDNDCTWQWPKAAELVKKELEEIKPKYCIVLTNYSWWKDFSDYLQRKSIPGNYGELIEAVQEYNETKIIITKRPYAGSSDAFVKQIIDITGQEKIQ